MAYGNYPNLQNVKKILVVMLRQIGDVLLSTPVFSTLQSKLPHAQIDAYVYRDTLPMLEGHPAISEIIPQDRKASFKNNWTALKHIRKNQYDLVISLTEGDRGAIFSKLSKAPIRVGFEPKGKWQKKLYTHLVKHTPTLKHRVEKNLDALRKIGLFPQEEEKELFLDIPQDLIQKMHSFSPFVLIHPTSRWRFKCWPIEKMRDLSSALLKMGKKLIFTSGPDPLEMEMVEEITKGLDVVNLSGKISLKELAALIKISETLICVDSVPFHIANALKKRVIALFGPTSDITWGPWKNQSAKILTQPFSCRPCYQDGCGGSKRSECLTTLPVEKVLKAFTDENRPQDNFVLLGNYE